MQSTSRTFSLRNAVRTSGLALTAAGLVLTATHGAQAQTYIGNAYDAGANVGVGLSASSILNLNVDAAAAVGYTGALPSSGGAINKTLLAANANINYLVVTPVVGISGNPSGNAQVGISSTVGASGVVNSSASINNVNVLQGFLTASTVTSHAMATFSSGLVGGYSNFTNLVFDGASVNVTGAANQVVDVYTGVGNSVLGAELVINEQTLSSDKTTFTTNALDLHVYDSTLDTAGVNGKVIVASSTVGSNGGGLAVAPEPGAVTLMLSALPCIGGVIGIGRRRRAAGRA